jgi:HEPN domain-containing protein
MRRNFKEWFEDAEDFLDHYEYACSKTKYKMAAFNLHQTAENLYHTICLVFTGYKYKLHNIEKLGKKTAVHSEKLRNVFPKTTDEEKRLFKLLKEAYVRARYDKSYSITPEELEYLSGCVRNLQGLTEKLCKEKIKNTVKK